MFQALRHSQAIGLMKCIDRVSDSITHAILKLSTYSHEIEPLLRRELFHFLMKISIVS
jgi:hypothetical protein